MAEICFAGPRRGVDPMEGERSKRARSSSPNPHRLMLDSGGVSASTPPPPPSLGQGGHREFLPLAFLVSANGDDIPMYAAESPGFIHTDEATVQGYLLTEAYVRYSSYLLESQISCRFTI